ncbi:class I SAM-dependent methyltransferase [Glycomyces luteolus]|uniref:Class I SAM-dependent methyltransferase n=1 Tax=Glycomyces luteolus TaxID=2670330 RepID=A0A9X3STG9_9ACTN|nr:class I SAM-dependent methyltransferase [Glycomyces luteolus]MDA1360253.1 class I SAM-dependent methyltransferase [Glycomyces luteolus]
MNFDANAARSFGPAADLYDSIRPAYPAEALAWLTGDAPKEVVDVGAGTGILTRGLIALGHNVTAVEPDPQMLAKLTAASPGLAAGHEGAAEALPLPDASADVITAGQAFHWFDRPKALPELHRVLRADGVLAPIWNIRDTQTPWVAAVWAAIDSSQGERDAFAALEPGYFGDGFAEPEHRVFSHERLLDRPGVLRLVHSRSYYLTADDALRERITRDVLDILDHHPDLEGKDTFALPYRTHAFRVRPA